MSQPKPQPRSPAWPGPGLLVHDWIETRPHITDITQVRFSTALLVGLAQCLSLVPGVSRPGATIVSGLLVGMHRRVATEYSYFLAIPVMISATLYTLDSKRALLTGVTQSSIC
jgi:undecaprenyl-diphosphatase